MLESSLDGVAAPLPLAPEERSWLGRYELLHRLGVGGMAELFLARTTSHAGFEKLVAVKRVLAEHADNTKLVEMLLSEARLAATLHHPNIVQVYDVDDDDGTYFFTMEYVQGKNLREVIRSAARQGKWLPLEHVINIAIGAAAGLNHAHDQRAADGTPLGIVHRDISPSNILISYEGTPKIVDFGIAKAANDPRSDTAGALRGKVPYMSPEQCRGEPLDRRSDIFSLGIILWELSLGKRLFANLKGQELVEHIANTQAPRPSTFKPDFPPDLERIIMRALHLDRDRRYASARELQLDLEDFARERKLGISAARLAEFMRELFSVEIADEEAAIREYIALAPIAPSPRDRRTHTQTSLTPVTLEPHTPMPVPLPPPIAETPWWQEPKTLAIGVGGLLVLLVVAALFVGGDEPTAPPPKARSGGAQAWDESADALGSKPVTAPEHPAVQEIIVASPPTEPPRPEASADDPKTTTTPTTPTKKKSKAKLPDDWDPNSPLPPPK